MVNPTNCEPHRFVPRTGRDVWTFTGPPGYLESIQASGSVAAPLLAGASFTLVALVLQSATPFGRWQDLALLLLVGAGLAQIFAVQSVIWTRRYMVTPDELRQWFPDDFTNDGERPTQWLVNVQEFNDKRARKWADRTRTWINAGISLLLAGVAVGVVPPGHISALRWAIVAVAWAGVAAEASWVAAAMVDEPARLRMLLLSAAIFTSGGATAAAGFAATTTTPVGAPATWWAVALAVATVPFWLAVCTDARLSHGHVRLRSPLSGGLAVVRAALALLAPAVIIVALWSAIRELAKDRHAMLSGLHPGVEELLPKGVSLGAHHRAWARCTASPVSRQDELAELLRESSQRLEQDGQSPPDRLWEPLVRSPGCAVKVVDSDDARVQFGYFVACPLLGETASRIRSGEITAGYQLSSADLAASPEAAAGWYISVIWAPGPRWTRRCVIATLVDALVASGAGSGKRETPCVRAPSHRSGSLAHAEVRFRRHWRASRRHLGIREVSWSRR
jgi:hypothetical protein